MCRITTIYDCKHKTVHYSECCCTDGISGNYLTSSLNPSGRCERRRIFSGGKRCQSCETTELHRVLSQCKPVDTSQSTCASMSQGISSSHGSPISAGKSSRSTPPQTPETSQLPSSRTASSRSRTSNNGPPLVYEGKLTIREPVKRTKFINPLSIHRSPRERIAAQNDQYCRATSQGAVAPQGQGPSTPGQNQHSPPRGFYGELQQNDESEWAYKNRPLPPLPLFAKRAPPQPLSARSRLHAAYGQTDDRAINAPWPSQPPTECHRSNSSKVIEQNTPSRSGNTGQKGFRTDPTKVGTGVDSDESGKSTGLSHISTTSSLSRSNYYPPITRCGLDKLESGRGKHRMPHTRNQLNRPDPHPPPTVIERKPQAKPGKNSPLRPATAQHRPIQQSEMKHRHDKSFGEPTIHPQHVPKHNSRAARQPMAQQGKSSSEFRYHRPSIFQGSFATTTQKIEDPERSSEPAVPQNSIRDDPYSQVAAASPTQNHQQDISRRRPSSAWSNSSAKSTKSIQCLLANMFTGHGNNSDESFVCETAKVVEQAAHSSNLDDNKRDSDQVRRSSPFWRRHSSR